MANDNSTNEKSTINPLWTALSGAILGAVGVECARHPGRFMDYSKALGHLESKKNNGLSTLEDRVNESLIKTEEIEHWPFTHQFNIINSDYYVKKVLEEANIAPLSRRVEGLTFYNESLFASVAIGALLGYAFGLNQNKKHQADTFSEQLRNDQGVPQEAVQR